MAGWPALPPPGYEGDEIEGLEFLYISFSEDVFVSGIHLTDLFYEGDPSFQETGYSGWTGPTTFGSVQFFAELNQIPGSTNGVKVLQLGEWVTELSFWAPGKINGQGHEFAVAGLSAAPIPEPTSAILFTVGGLIVGAAARRRARGSPEA